MYIDKNSFIVNGVNLGEYIIQIEYQYPKLWGNDAGRNLAGTFSGTLIGIFPKFVVTFRKLTKNELVVLAPIFDNKAQTVQYYDPNKNQKISVKTYTGDWSVTSKNVGGKTTGPTISFICRSKR